MFGSVLPMLLVTHLFLLVWFLLKGLRVLLQILLVIRRVYEPEDIALAESDDVIVLQHRRFVNAPMIRHKRFRFRRTGSQCHDPV